MSREREMKQYLLPYRLKWLDDRMGDIQKDTGSSIKDALFPLLREMIQEVISMQEEGSARNAAYLAVYYLRSSAVTGSHEYLVMLADQKLYLDSQRVERYWCPEQLYRRISGDVQSACDEIKKKFIRVSEYEKDCVRRFVEEDYISFLEVGLSMELPRILEWEIFRQMKKEQGFQCVYGEYMGEQKQLFSLS